MIELVVTLNLPGSQPDTTHTVLQVARPDCGAPAEPDRPTTTRVADLMVDPAGGGSTIRTFNDRSAPFRQRWQRLCLRWLGG
jgi:hypothetical protein